MGPLKLALKVLGKFPEYELGFGNCPGGVSACLTKSIHTLCSFLGHFSDFY